MILVYVTEMLKFFYVETTNMHFFVFKFKSVKDTNKYVLYMYVLNSTAQFTYFLSKEGQMIYVL